MKNKNIRKISISKNKSYNVTKNENYVTKTNRIKATPINQPHFNTVPNKPLFKAEGTPKNTNIKIALMFHSYYEDVSNKIYEDLLQLNKLLKFDLYVSVCSSGQTNTTNFINKFRTNLNANIFTYPNIGKDIIPKLRMLQYLCNTDKEYDYIFLFHDKKSVQYLNDPRCSWMNKWYDELVTPLFNDTYRNATLKLFEEEESIGAIGIGKHLHYGPGWYNGMADRRFDNETELLKNQRDIERRLGLPELSQSWFVGGTMFWVRYKILKDFIKRYDMNHLFELTKRDLENVQDPSYTHCIERFFGHIIKLSNYKLIGLK